MGAPKPENKAITLRRVTLTPSQKRIIRLETPQEFIKTRPGKGKKTFSYVEVGYVTAKLNEVFSHVGWDFEVLHEEVLDKEVWVRGKLTVKDPTTDYTVTKTNYGTKERYPGEVPLGDTLKAAAGDCLKKCASMFGVASDVYWQHEDGDKATGKAAPQTPKHQKMPMEQARVLITGQKNIELLLQWDKRIRENKLYSQAEKDELLKLISSRVSILDGTTGQ